MKEGKSLVKSKKAVVGEITYPIFDSVEEAVGQLGAEKTLNLINVQTKTNALNAKRAEAAGKPSKKVFMAKAMASISIEEFQSAAGDAAKLQGLIEAKAAALEAEWKASQPEPSDDEEGDDDED